MYRRHLEPYAVVNFSHASSSILLSSRMRLGGQECIFIRIGCGTSLSKCTASCTTYLLEVASREVGTIGGGAGISRALSKLLGDPNNTFPQQTMHALDLHKTDAHTAPIVPNPCAKRVVAKLCFKIMHKLDNYYVNATDAIFETTFGVELVGSSVGLA